MSRLFVVFAAIAFVVCAEEVKKDNIQKTLDAVSGILSFVDKMDTTHNATSPSTEIMGTIKTLSTEPLIRDIMNDENLAGSLENINHAINSEEMQHVIKKVQEGVEQFAEQFERDGPVVTLLRFMGNANQFAQFTEFLQPLADQLLVQQKQGKN
eukprot:c2055_g1_i1.p1 GENE.c2055_g1_i1~~c2055_g1_i1.p1  ORF type:complete len:163 (+),score=57.62 c2055_g1_i1:30-491(+)